MSMQSWLKKAESQLRTGPHPERARADAELLMMHLTGCDRAFLIAHPEKVISALGAVRYYALVERRAGGEPIQQITGEQEFYGLPFHVTRDVLIPRPETEHLVERALELAAQWAVPRIADVGCGSGAIAVALAHQLPQAKVTAIDLSAAALAVARKNATRNGVGAIRFIEGDLLGPVAGESFELIVSNPPYIPDADRATLAVEVREYEPALALFAGADGLSIYRRLIPQAYAGLVAGGWLLLEMGCGQHTAIEQLLLAAGFESVELVADLQGIARVAVARKR